MVDDQPQCPDYTEKALLHFFDSTPFATSFCRTAFLLLHPTPPPTYSQPHTHTHTHTHTLHTHSHTHTRTHTLTHARTHTHIHSRTHTQQQFLFLDSVMLHTVICLLETIVINVVKSHHKTTHYLLQKDGVVDDYSFLHKLEVQL